jgi:hypothetical protein
MLLYHLYPVCNFVINVDAIRKALILRCAFSHLLMNDEKVRSASSNSSFFVKAPFRKFFQICY